MKLLWKVTKFVLMALWAFLVLSFVVRVVLARVADSKPGKTAWHRDYSLAISIGSSNKFAELHADQMRDFFRPFFKRLRLL